MFNSINFLACLLLIFLGVSFTKKKNKLSDDFIDSVLLNITPIT